MDPNQEYQQDKESQIQQKYQIQDTINPTETDLIQKKNIIYNNYLSSPNENESPMSIIIIYNYLLTYNYFQSIRMENFSKVTIIMKIKLNKLLLDHKNLVIQINKKNSY